MDDKATRVGKAAMMPTAHIPPGIVPFCNIKPKIIDRSSIGPQFVQASANSHVSNAGERKAANVMHDRPWLWLRCFASTGQVNTVSVPLNFVRRWTPNQAAMRI
jgi:hypothetical protein